MRHRSVRARETPAKHKAGRVKGVGDLFDGYGETARGLTEAAFDEMVGLGGATRSPYAGGGVLAVADGTRGRLGPGHPAGPGLHGPGRDVRPRRRGTPVPSRRRAAHLHRGRMEAGVHRGGPEGARPRGVPGRHLRGGPHRERRSDPPRSDHELAGFRARRLRPVASQRGPHPCGRHRCHPRRGGRVPGPRGQRPQSLGRELCPGQPGRHVTGPARALLGPTHPDGHRLPGAPDPRPAPRRPHRRAGPDRRGPHTGSAQLRLLRARPAGPPDGRAPGGGAGPGLPRHRGVPAHDRGRGPGPRDLPAHRR